MTTRCWTVTFESVAMSRNRCSTSADPRRMGRASGWPASSASRSCLVMSCEACSAIPACPPCQRHQVCRQLYTDQCHACPQNVCFDTHPATHVAPILAGTLSVVLGLAGLVAFGWWMRRRHSRQQELERYKRAQDMADRCIEAHRARCDEGTIDAFPLSMLTQPATDAPVGARDLWRISERTEPSSYSSKRETKTSNQLTE